jgi:hypothetical protein
VTDRASRRRAARAELAALLGTTFASNEPAAPRPREARRPWLAPGNGGPMFLLLAVALAIAWMASITIFHVSAAGIHFLLLAAILSAVMHFFHTHRLAGHH